MTTVETLARPVANHGASAASIQHHYDVSNEFFALWLDPNMVYSCAQYDVSEDLEQAQLYKLDEHLRSGGAAGAKRLLDIGCGWGANLARSVGRHNVAHAVGVTLSPNQARYIQERYVQGQGLTQIEARVEAWQDHIPDAPYDSIISLGAFEHFARYGMSRAQKVQAYREFFEKCRAWTRPGARMSLQTIVWGKLSVDSSNDFIINEIYPETDPPELSEIFDGAKGVFEAVTVRLDRDHYTRNLVEWRRRLRANREQATALVGEEVFSRYERYLALCAVAFHTGNLNLSRTALVRID